VVEFWLPDLDLTVEEKEREKLTMEMPMARSWRL
jgi:hypothetical protein